MWTYNKTDELYHYGVLGMKWGVRKAQFSERIALKRAAGAITDKRKDDFLKVAEKHRQTANNYAKQLGPQKVKSINPTKGRAIALGILSGLPTLATISTIAGVVSVKKKQGSSS